MLYATRESEKEARWYSKGREEGVSEYADKQKKLKARLSAMGKIEDFLRAIDDESYAQELFREYNIT